jgi:hypothetical protein
MPRKDKLSEKEKSALEDALRGASVSDSEVYAFLQRAWMNQASQFFLRKQGRTC